MAGPNQQAERRPRHSFEEHTGEVLVRLEAPSLEGLFAEAGRALAELLAGEPPVPKGQAERVQLEAPDRQTLLADFVNELIFLSETRKKVYSELEVERVEGGALSARVRGAEPDSLRTAVKAATFHRLEISEGPGGYSATLVLDV
ncbi:MAG: archease [Myxococcales bacterium]|nr:archease [Myxococcales bacterium]